MAALSSIFGSQNLFVGHTSTGVRVQLLCGANGSINGSTVGPQVHVGPKPSVSFYGKTAEGIALPIQVDTDGTLLFSS